MKDGPDIARVAALISDPARANMLTSLMAGKALTATELAAEAGVTRQTASTHLAKLRDGGLIQQTRHGRHHYVTLASSDVADLLETLMGVAARAGHMRTRTGPTDPELRRARVCYNHLAGEKGIALYDGMVQRGLLTADAEMPELTQKGADFVTDFGVDLDALRQGRAPLCKPCLDWSERRTHLAGSLGRALLTRMMDMRWVRRDGDSRAVIFSPVGQAGFTELFAPT